MNYRHAFHAGNFCDVLKHAVLMNCIEHLKRKSAPFRVIDIHAGAGIYDLHSDAAQRTGEWEHGIGRLLGPDTEPLPTDAAEALEPYLSAVVAMNTRLGWDVAREGVRFYPGSCELTRMALRSADRLVANELHPEDRASLQQHLAADRRVRVTALDAYTAWKANLPPPERRGLILVDPPFEVPGEFDRMRAGLEDGHRRFAAGTSILWYPRKDHRAVDRFLRQLPRGVGEELMVIQLDVCDERNSDMLFGAGLIVRNPPWTLIATLKVALPALCDRLKIGPGASFECRLL